MNQQSLSFQRVALLVSASIFAVSCAGAPFSSPSKTEPAPAPESEPEGQEPAEKPAEQPAAGETEEEKAERLRAEAAAAQFPEDVYTAHDREELVEKARRVLNARGQKKDYGGVSRLAIVTPEWHVDTRKTGDRAIQFRWVRVTVEWSKEDPRGFCWHDTYDLVQEYVRGTGWGSLKIGTVCKKESCSDGPIECQSSL